MSDAVTILRDLLRVVEVRLRSRYTGTGPEAPIGNAPCCGHDMTKEGDHPARAVVMWNRFNGVVSCHSCGEIYVPASALTQPESAIDIWRENGDGLPSGFHLGVVPAALVRRGDKILMPDGETWCTVGHIETPVGLGPDEPELFMPLGRRSPTLVTENHLRADGWIRADDQVKWEYLHEDYFEEWGNRMKAVVKEDPYNAYLKDRGDDGWELCARSEGKGFRGSAVSMHTWKRRRS